MDIALLVKLLAPCLPFLTGLGQKAAEKGAEKLGEQGVVEFLPQAKKIWGKLYPKVQAKGAAQEAAEAVAKDVDNVDAVKALRKQLKEILEAPENLLLVAEIAGILSEVEKYSSGEAKYNVSLKDSPVGLIGNHGKVTMNFGTNPHE
jgi:valyl-tRNA synthetase